MLILSKFCVSLHRYYDPKRPLFDPITEGMSTLSQLIEQLYAQCDAAAVGTSTTTPVAPADAATAGQDARVDRMLRTLREMADVLSPEDQPQPCNAAPCAEVCQRIITHWESFGNSLQSITDHMRSLDADIARMQPWGDFDVMKVEALAERGTVIRFWRIASDVIAQGDVSESSACHFVSTDGDWHYFVSVTQQGVSPVVPAGAEEVSICPCPISTLIMLQTRDKDALRRIDTLRGDYALIHYAEIYAALHEARPDMVLPVPQQPEGFRSRLRQLWHGLRSND